MSLDDQGDVSMGKTKHSCRWWDAASSPEISSLCLAAVGCNDEGPDTPDSGISWKELN